MYPGTDIGTSKREIPLEQVTTSLDGPSEVTTAKWLFMLPSQLTRTRCFCAGATFNFDLSFHLLAPAGCKRQQPRTAS